MIQNPIYAELRELGLAGDLALFFDRTRDAEIPVWRDRVSGVILLDSVKTSNQYYESEKAESRAGSDTVVQTRTGPVLTTALEDADRRLAQFQALIKDRSVCDFGCGHGDFLGRATAASARYGVELRGHCLDYIAATYPEVKASKSITDFADLDVVTMFHVLEHIPAQVPILAEIRRQLTAGGDLVVEVPHANDHLIHHGPDAFKGFTFWSEHLVLHTTESLTAVLKAAGYRDIVVTPFQRYGLANHHGWKVDERPGGHARYTYPASEDAAYKADVMARGESDTLIATAKA